MCVWGGLNDRFGLRIFFFFFFCLPFLLRVNQNGRFSLHTTGVAYCYWISVQRYYLFFICAN